MPLVVAVVAFGQNKNGYDVYYKSNIFAETLNWEYERVNNSALGEFMIYCNCRKMKYGTGYSAHLHIKDNIDTDEVEKILSIKNEREELGITNKEDKIITV